MKFGADNLKSRNFFRVSELFEKIDQQQLFRNLKNGQFEKSAIEQALFSCKKENSRGQ